LAVIPAKAGTHAAHTSIDDSFRKSFGLGPGLRRGDGTAFPHNPQRIN
jgi:hypothetical protein